MDDYWVINLHDPANGAIREIYPIDTVFGHLVLTCAQDGSILVHEVDQGSIHKPFEHQKGGKKWSNNALTIFKQWSNNGQTMAKGGQKIGKKLAKNWQKMDQKWTKNGLKMDKKWTKNGQKMDKKSSNEGQKMGKKMGKLTLKNSR